MLRRLLLIWLVTSILGYGMALAYDAHETQVNDSVAASDLVSSAIDADHCDDGDHCCHGVVHLLGLGYRPALGLNFDNAAPAVAEGANLHSLAPMALFRPPIFS